MSEMIVCPYKLGNKTREQCNECKYCSLGDCPPGAYFVRNKEGDRKLFEDYLYDPNTPTKLKTDELIGLKIVSIKVSERYGDKVYESITLENGLIILPASEPAYDHWMEVDKND